MKGKTSGVAQAQCTGQRSSLYKIRQGEGGVEVGVDLVGGSDKHQMQLSMCQHILCLQTLLCVLSVLFNLDCKSVRNIL